MTCSVFKARRFFVEQPVGLRDGFRRVFRVEDGASERDEIRAGFGGGDDAFQRVSGLCDAGDFNHLRPPSGQRQVARMGVRLVVRADFAENT